MKINSRWLGLILISVLTLSSCQKTNVSDLISFRRIADDKVQDYQKSISIASTRDALVLDSLDNSQNKISLSKGTKLQVLGLRGTVGSFKTIPVIFRKNFKGDDVWLAELSDGRRVYVKVPEIYSGEEPVTSNEIAIYFPHRHYTPLFGETNNEDLDKPWKKFLFHAGKVIDYATEHTLSRLLYKDGSFYQYTPVIRSKPQWLVRGVQAVLSFFLLAIIFYLLVPWLSLNTFWHFRLLPNWLVKLLSSIFCFIFAFFIGAFLGLTPVGFCIWALMLLTRYFCSIRDDVDWERCPHCHRLGIHYKDTKYGDWRSSRREWDKEEVKNVTNSEHDEYNGVGVTHVKETTYHKGLKHYIGVSHSRSVTENLKCPHCHRDIQLYSTEEKYNESSEWK